MANILTAEQLVEERLKATKKQLPSFGPKDFCVTGSSEEKEKIHNILSTTKSLLACERVEKSNLLSNAEWIIDLQLAKVTKKVGKFFETFGHSVNGCDYLYPEESLFLLENSNLELYFSGLTVSIQRGYSLLLGPDTGCSLNEYRVYAYLSKSGYRVFRHDDTTLVQNRGGLVCSTPVVSISESVKPATFSSNTRVEASAKSAGNSEVLDACSSRSADDFASDSNTDGALSSRGEGTLDSVSGRLQSDSFVASSNEGVAEHINSSKSTTAAADKPPSIENAMAMLKNISDNMQVNKRFPSKGARTKLKRALRNALSERFYPPASESLFNQNTQLIKFFISPKNLKVVPVTAVGPKLSNLLRDGEFASISQLFPTFANGEFNAFMPPNPVVPRKVSSIFFSTTINLDTNKIVHGLKSSLISGATSAEGAGTNFDEENSLPQPGKRWEGQRGQVRRSNARKTRYFNIGNKQSRNSNSLAQQTRAPPSKKSLKRLKKKMKWGASNNNSSSREEMGNVESSGTNKTPNIFNLNTEQPDARMPTFGSSNESNAPTPNMQTHHQQIQVKPEFQHFTGAQFDSPINQPPHQIQPVPGGQAPFNSPANPLDPNVLGQVIANVVSQLLPNQMNPNLTNHMNSNPFNTASPNILNPPTLNFQNPLPSNPQNPLMHSVQNAPFSNFQNQAFQNFTNPMNSNPFYQSGASFSNQSSPNFFNQSTPNFHHQNFTPRFPSQRFPRPFSNYGNNNSEVSEVTRHARKMQGMAKRMMALAQAMFKNPEEFAENPEKINTFNYSNRFRHPSNQGSWRYPNQMPNSNENQWNNSRPRFANNYYNNHSNFNRNPNNSNFSENCYPNNFKNQNSSSQQRNNGKGSENQSDIPETKFNPSAAASASSSSSREGNDNTFFIDVTGENPSHLSSKARTIPGSKPTISFGEKRPAESSSSSESESDGDDIQVLESAKKQSQVETIDVLSSDEEVFMSIASKVSRSKQEADKICSKVNQAFKVKSSGGSQGNVNKKQRTNRNAEIITLEEDIMIVDDESTSHVEKSAPDPSAVSSPNLESAAVLTNPTATGTTVCIKQEEDCVTRVKTERSTDEDGDGGGDGCGPENTRIKQELDDGLSKRSDVSHQVLTGATADNIKTEIHHDSEEEGESRNQNLGSDDIRETTEMSNDSAPPTVRKDFETEGESMDGSATREESIASESDEDSKSSTSSNQVPVKKSRRSSTKGQSAIAEEGNKTSSCVLIDLPIAESPSSNGWAAMKASKHFQSPDGFGRTQNDFDQGKTVSERFETEPQESHTREEAGISDKPSSLQDERKERALLQPHHCKNLGTVLSALQIFKSKTDAPEELDRLKVSFDVYQPKKVFGKVSRPDPDFRIIVKGYTDPVPSPSQIDDVAARYGDNVKILFAVVHPNSVSFFFIGNVHVPVQIDEVIF